MSGWPQNDGVALDPRKPRALGICDFCAQTWHRDELQFQYEFGGFGLINLHYLVCPRCMDKPQEQLRSLVLPPDPRPVINPRTENYDLDSQLQGFSQNVVVTPPLSPVITYAQLISFAVTQKWGIPQPALTNQSTTLTTAFVSQQIVPAGSYGYLLIYNATFSEIAISQTSPASFVAPTRNTQIGGGTAMLQNVQASQSVWQGPVYAISTQSNVSVLIATG